MNRKIIVKVLCMLLVMGGYTQAEAQEYAPQAGDKTISLRLGKSVDYPSLSYYEVNAGMSSNSVSIGQPVSRSSFYSDGNSIVNAIGVEGKYFLTSNIALRLAGGGMIVSSPSRDAVEGVGSVYYDYPGTAIPGYAHLEGRTTMQFYGDVGADYYFATKVPRLFPYAGVQANGVYGQMEIYDGYRGLDGNGEVIPTYDTRRGEVYAFGGSLVGGVDYYLAEGFFFGFEIKTVSYMYNVKRIFHQQGMEAQEAASHVTTIFAEPVLKIGFKF
nr:BT1926 family outer membrane beta-barrel protein [uncultured Carboxylicivirga sp.]